jgi:hypothetical protein
MNERQVWCLRFMFFGLAAFQAGQSGFSSDVSVYSVRKGLEYTQVDSGTPSLNATNSNAFEATVGMSGPTTVTNAAVQPPGGVPLQPLVLSTGSKWDYKKKYNSLAKLDQHYPDGTYTFQIAGVTDGLRQPALSLLGSVYPNGPYIQNFPATQAVNANGYFLVTWGSFSGGDTNDFVQFRVEDLAGNKFFETPDFGKPSFWDGTAARVLLGPGSSAYGQTNRVTLTFQKSVGLDQTSYPGALGAAAYFSRTTFYLVTTKAGAPDVKVYEISKARKWVQSSSNSVVAETGQEFVFDASVQAYTTGILSSASVTLAPTTNPPSRNLVLQSNGTKLDFSDVAGTAPGLDAFYGSGTYTLSFPTTHDGNKSVSLLLPADNFPPAPHISNFAALQVVNAAQPLMVSWDGWTNGTIGDFVQVRVEDHNFNKFFETPDLGKAGALDGRATSAVIPAGTLPAGQSFEIHVTFTRISALDTTSYSGVLGLSDFQARTKFNIQTAPVTGSRPVLTLTALPSSQGWQLSALAVSNALYRIDGSGDLQQWTILGTNQPRSNLLQWQDPTQRGGFFYRAVVLP